MVNNFEQEPTIMMGFVPLYTYSACTSGYFVCVVLGELTELGSHVLKLR